MQQVAAQLQELLDEMKEVKLEMKAVQARIDGLGTINAALTMILDERLTSLQKEKYELRLSARKEDLSLEQSAGECAAPFCSRFRALGCAGKGMAMGSSTACAGLFWWRAGHCTYPGPVCT